MDERDQERALTNLLAHGLRQSLDAGGADCPEPDVVAAYADRSLSDAEMAHWEEHFSNCARCQEVLTAFVLSESEAVPVAEAVAAARAAAAADAARAAASAGVPAEAGPGGWGAPGTPRPKRVVTPRRQWVNWRWLVPAMAAAAAVILWVAIRPPKTGGPISTTQVAENTRSATPGQAADQNVRQAPTASPNDLAQGLPITPPEAVAKSRTGILLSEPKGREGARSAGRARPKSAPTYTARSGPSPEIPSSSSSAKSVLQPPKPGETRKDEKQTANLEAEGKQKEADKLSTMTTPHERRPAKPAAPAEKMDSAELAKQYRIQQEVAEALKPAPSPPPSQSAGSAKKAAIAGAAHRSNLPATREDKVLIAYPSAAVVWRVGRGGSIERSQDDGRTWKVQASDVNADLLAGSAPFATVCWVVGRAGTVLRTMDGEHWEKISSPTQADLIAIEALDTLKAIITVADNKRYITSDGGRHWRIFISQ